jgi:hypothetical protein
MSSQTLEQKIMHVLDERDRHHAILLDTINDNVFRVLECLDSFDKKVDDHHKEFCEFREEVNYKFDIVFERLDRLDNRFVALGVWVTNLEIRVANVEVALVRIETRMDAVEK